MNKCPLLFLTRGIVKDCEAIRKILLGNKEKEEDQKWTIMGQSFGGFCAITYLSFHSEGLKEVFITGGLASLGGNPDPNYEATIRTCATSWMRHRKTDWVLVRIVKARWCSGMRFTMPNILGIRRGWVNLLRCNLSLSSYVFPRFGTYVPF